MKRNISIIDTFIDIPVCTLKNRTLSCQHNVLYSYNEIIGIFDISKNLFYVSHKKISKTTSRHINLLTRSLTKFNKPYIEIDDLDNEVRKNEYFLNLLDDYSVASFFPALE